MTPNCFIGVPLYAWRIVRRVSVVPSAGNPLEPNLSGKIRLKMRSGRMLLCAPVSTLTFKDIGCLYMMSRLAHSSSRSSPLSFSIEESSRCSRSLEQSSPLSSVMALTVLRHCPSFLWGRPPCFFFFWNVAFLLLELLLGVAPLPQRHTFASDFSYDTWNRLSRMLGISGERDCHHSCHIARSPWHGLHRWSMSMFAASDLSHVVGTSLIRFCYLKGFR